MAPIGRAATWADMAELVWQFVGHENTAAETRNGVLTVLGVRRGAGVPEAHLREQRRIAELLIADVYADDSTG